MKAILICPAEHSAVERLCESKPLVLVPMLGKTLVDYWMEHLAAEKYTEVILLAADRPEEVRAYVEQGERWGVKTEVWPVTKEISKEEVASIVQDGVARDCIEIMDFLPLLPEQKIFSDYNAWFTALTNLLSKTSTETRIGVHEVQPGVWRGLHESISSEATLIAPCWIGKDVVIEADAVVGPFALIEDGVCIEKGAEVANSVVMNETLVGEWTEVQNSIAWADTLIHIPDGVSSKVADEFLLSGLDEHPEKIPMISVTGKIAAVALLTVIAPFACLAMVRSICTGKAYMRVKTAVRPRWKPSDKPLETIEYFEVASRYGWIRRWPQLWEAVCGRFALIGNRPLTDEQAAGLQEGFEKLWLAVPTGVISLADVESDIDVFGARARAHACYYAVKGDWQLDCAIFYAVVIGRPLASLRATFRDLVPVPMRYPELGR